MILESTHNHKQADGPRKGKESKSKRTQEKDSYHNRIRSVKQKYPELSEIIERLDKQRATTPLKLNWRTPSKVQSSPYHAQPARKTSKHDESGVEYVPNNIHQRKNSTPKELANNSAALDPRAPDVSAIAPPRPRSNLLSESVDMAAIDHQATFDWDEQGIDARRKLRHRLRPPSRAESEFSDSTASSSYHSENNRYYYYGSNWHSHHHTGGRYTPNLSFGGGSHGGYSRNYSHYDGRPRPHSAFDREAYERERGRMHDPGYRYEHDEDDDSESWSDETESESVTEEELAEYDYQQRQQCRRARDLYYFNLIRLPNDLITHGLRRYPPPRGYETLASIEKAAYLYYFSLYHKYISPVAFRKIFAYQYSRFMLPHDSTPEKALEMIVQWTRAEYEANVLAWIESLRSVVAQQAKSSAHQLSTSLIGQESPGTSQIEQDSAATSLHGQDSLIEQESPGTSQIEQDSAATSLIRQEETTPDSGFVSPNVQQSKPSASAKTATPPPMKSISSPLTPVQQQPTNQPACQVQQQLPPAALLRPAPASAPPNSEGRDVGQPQRVTSSNRRIFFSFARLTTWLTNLIPDRNEMKLPDDSNPSIRYDATLRMWVGEGVATDEASAHPPPVAYQQSATATMESPTAPNCVRLRYVNAFDLLGGGSLTDGPGPSTAVVQPPAPPVPVALQGFIPMIPAENEYSDVGAAEDYGSPFSTGDPFSYPDPNQQQTDVAK